MIANCYLAKFRRNLVIASPFSTLPGWRGRTLLIIALVLVVSVCGYADNLAGGAYATASETVVKSPKDGREYRSFRLANGLSGLIVSDPESSRAAAAMSVDVGSGDDPQDLPGLAHFLEHMLFLGTKKYPLADDYQSFMSDRGGFHNAYTAHDHTNYFFELDAPYLTEALDRFSRFFIDPLFNADFVKRERQAVNSEYRGSLSRDDRRIWEGRQQALNPASSLSRFSIGSSETLSDRADMSVRDQLIYFYGQYYSASRMRLTVYGREPIAELQAMIQQNFRTIAARGEKIVRPKVPMFVPGSLPLEILIKPLKESRVISVSFPVPWLEGFRPAKPDHYLAALLGDEGEGSLLQFLKTENLATNLWAGASTGSQTESLFDVTIGLTPKGLADYDNVIRYVFDYIQLIKSTGIQAWRHAEQANLAGLGFLHAERTDPGRYVSMLSASLQRRAATRVLVDPYDAGPFDPSAIRSLLAYLTTDNVLVSVVDPELSSQTITKWHQVPYQITESPDSMRLASWSPLPTEHSGLKLPPRNIYIPEDTPVYATGMSPQRPERIVGDTDFTHYYQQDGSFEEPRASFYCNLRSPFANSSARAFATTALMVAATNEQLNHLAYPAKVAGQSFALYQHRRGVSFRVHGYDRPQRRLLADIIDGLSQVAINEVTFRRLVDDYVRSLTNRSLNSAYKQTLQHLYQILLDPDFGDQALIDAALDLQLEEMIAHHQQYFKNLDVSCLSHGNLTQSEALARGDLVRAKLMSDSVPSKVDPPKVVRLLEDASVATGLDTERPNYAVTMYIQATSKSISEQVYFDMIGQILAPLFYHQIRTLDQFGYHVFLQSDALYGVAGLSLTVQSPQKNVHQIVDRMEQFLVAAMAHIESLSPAEFDSLRQTLLNQYSEPEKSLEVRSGRYWREIDRGYLEFDFKQQLIEKLSVMEQDALIAKSQQVLSEGYFRRLLVHSGAAKDGFPGYVSLSSKNHTLAEITDRFSDKADSEAL